jgi:hypothetical protein
MSVRRIVVVAAGLLLSLGVQADGTVKLYCAAKATGFSEAEMQLRERGPNLVNVTFSRTRPSKAVIDWALRDCLATAIKLNAARDIVALAWFRAHASAALQPLEPYSADARVVYSASRQAVLLRKTLSTR